VRFDQANDVFARVQQRAADVQVRKEARREFAPPEQMFLPGLDDWLRAMPNPIARSSLFAPIARGRKQYHEKTVLVSRRDATIMYTGHQLDESQSDAWMQLVYAAKDAPLGQAVNINRAAFLREIGHGTSGRDYQWLHRAMYAFTAATIVIEVRKPDGAPKYRIGDTKAFHMLADFEYDENAEVYTFTIDPRWKKLFGGREYALIDWEKRLHIGPGQDMAKALQRLVATSSDPVQRYSLDWLKDKLQYASPIRKFRLALVAAMHELERVEVIAGGRLERSTKGREQAAWTKLAP
jgi:hypothetical protein